MTISDIGRSMGSAVLQRVGRLTSRMQESKPLAADVLEGDDAYLVIFDAPGATGSDVQVRYVDGTVHVRIDRFREFYEGFEMVFPGRGLALDGEATLPEDALVEVEHASATLTQEGTLEIRVPKGESTGPTTPEQSAEI
jgi:HSP20 family molecular chaperone IbpA